MSAEKGMILQTGAESLCEILFPDAQARKRPATVFNSQSFDMKGRDHFDRGWSRSAQIGSSLLTLGYRCCSRFVTHATSNLRPAF
jgi:hypothetical protein